jgi:heat-inducible transcriptional repressor
LTVEYDGWATILYRNREMHHEQQPSQLDERSRNVLKTVIKEYVRVGKPVGSRRLSRIYRENLSPATLRMVMADLEEAGYLTQPHTSAGRIPTQEGYRLYVQFLLKTKALPPEQLGQIRKCLEDETDPLELMNKTSRLLSAYSNNIGIVLPPPLSRASLRHVEFVKIGERRILVILVSRAGLVQRRFLRMDEDFSQTELDQAGRYLVEHFSGRSLSEIRSDLIRMMSREQALYDRLLKTVILVGSATLSTSDEEEADESQVYLGGTARLLRSLESADIDRLIALLQTFEERKRLVKIITECLRETAHGPSVTIGLEKHIPGMRDWTLITSPYRCDGQTSGTLSILGPSRMEYDRAISLVDYVARLFGQIMGNN